MGIITYDGRVSTDYGIIVEVPPGYDMAERDYEIQAIPGRNGDLAFDKGSYKNTTRQYNIVVTDQTILFSDMAGIISKWLGGTSGYKRLQDTYEPDYYRLALYAQPTSIQNIWNGAARADISFNCKPQRFLISGDDPITFDSAGELTNPSVETALPIIKCYGSGEGVVRVNSRTVTLTNIEEFVVVDSDIQSVYKNTTEKNNDAKLPLGFPTLTAGVNEISFTGGITSVEVMPKWWVL